MGSTVGHPSNSCMGFLVCLVHSTETAHVHVIALCEIHWRSMAMTMTMISKDCLTSGNQTLPHNYTGTLLCERDSSTDGVRNSASKVARQHDLQGAAADDQKHTLMRENNVVKEQGNWQETTRKIVRETARLENTALPSALIPQHQRRCRQQVDQGEGGSVVTQTDGHHQLQSLPPGLPSTQVSPSSRRIAAML